MRKTWKAQDNLLLNYSIFYEKISLLMHLNSEFKLSSTILSMRDISFLKVPKKVTSREEISDPLTKNEQVVLKLFSL
jgi:hypothetical protein